MPPLTNELLPFEVEKCRNLQRFPMYFRLKLDICGIKLSKRDWNTFPLSEKQHLLAMPCDTQEQVSAFREKLKTMLHACNGELVEFSQREGSVDRGFPWTDKMRIPTSVQHHLDAFSKGSANSCSWAALSDLQRFALIKLTQPGHVKDELRMILQEFSILPSETPDRRC